MAGRMTGALDTPARAVSFFGLVKNRTSEEILRITNSDIEQNKVSLRKWHYVLAAGSNEDKRNFWISPAPSSVNKYRKRALIIFTNNVNAAPDDFYVLPFDLIWPEFMKSPTRNDGNWEAHVVNDIFYTGKEPETSGIPVVNCHGRFPLPQAILRATLENKESEIQRILTELATGTSDT